MKPANRSGPAAGPGDGAVPRQSPVFRARGLRFRYPGAARPALDSVELAVEAGELYGVIGPNGAGKSTLVRLLAGSRQPDQGAVLFEGRPPGEGGRRQLARRLGVVAQREEVAFPLTVREFVAMGRYPHLGPWRAERDEDRRSVRRAMRACDLDGLAERAFSTLSGGERQLARVARALAQEPQVLLLDEPAVSLDLRHEMEIFELLRRLVDAEGVTVVVVTHHLNAAARAADRLLLLDGGRSVAEGAPGDVLTREAVERAWRWPVRVTPHPGPGPDEGAPQVVPLRGEGAARQAPAPSRPAGREPEEPGDRPSNPDDDHRDTI